MANVAFNGKFLSAGSTAVHTVAEELICALDRQLATDEDLSRRISAEILAPKNADRDLNAPRIPKRTAGRLTGQLWEQVELASLAKDRLLISLCNLAPIRARHAITMVHDAQVFSSPASYSAAFRKFYRFALPRIGNAHARLLTVSDFSRQELARYGVAPREKIHVIHNGVDHVLRTDPDPAILDRLELRPGKFSVGLANAQAHKNVGLVLQAMQNPDLQHHRLVLFGPASADDFLAAGHPVSENIIFAGFVTDAERRALLEAARTLIFPSRTEGFGLPPLEAMLCGTPAIVAPCGALPEVCGNVTVYADPNDAEAWAQAILDFARMHDTIYANSADAARRHAESFTWDAAGRQLAEQICCVLEPEHQR